MYHNTSIKHVSCGEVSTLPIDGQFGFARMPAKQSCLVIVPCPEDKKGLVIPDEILKNLGYFYVDKDIASKFSSLLSTLQNS